MSDHVLLVCGMSAEAAADLAERGFQTEIADDGYRAIELAERTRPPYAFIDIDVPGPPPVELVERVKEGAARVLVRVAESAPERDVELLGAGADGIITGDHDESFLVWALARVSEGGLVLSPEIARGLTDVLEETFARRGDWAQQLAERTRQAEALARAKSDFLGNVSHELRTPLTIIKGVAATIRMTVPPGDQSEMLGQMERAADKLTLMIESIITHASMERGEYTVNATRCDLAPTIREAAEEAVAGYEHIVLETAIPPTVPAVADIRAIRGVVRQLVDNACRYSDAGGVVTVKARVGDEGVTVHVTDRGVGIDREKIAAALAEAFTPGEEIMRKERAGLGIGLNLARNLVALHGGIVWAEPLPGGGSRVSFTIPPEVPQVTTHLGDAPVVVTSSPQID